MSASAADRVSLDPLRMRLVHLSTASMFGTIALFPFIYVLDAPLTSADLLRVLQQILPVFVGFLVSAIGYAFATRRELLITPERYEMINFILIWSFIFYWIGLLATTGLFLWSHSRFAPVGDGMDRDVLFGILTLLLSCVTGMTGLITTKMFLEESQGSSSQATKGSAL